MNRNDRLDSRGKRRVQTVFEEESLTVQSDAARADIRNILRKYKEVGIVDHLAHVNAMYRDVSEFTDLHDAMLQAKQAEADFNKLPPQLRGVFKNDVTRWLDAAHDPEKLETLYRPELEKIGVLEPKVVETPVVETPPSTPPDS